VNAAATVARIELGVVFATILCLVVVRMLTGRINVDGLLAQQPGMPVSPERAQLLVATLGAAGYLLLSTIQARAEVITFPSEGLIVLFGGSHLTYLITKYLRPSQPPRYSIDL
jgi:hypothetical protein